MARPGHGLHAFLWLSAVIVASAVDHTHVNNLSSKNICATTSYWTLDGLVDRDLVQTGSSKFVGREVTAGNSDTADGQGVDLYNAGTNNQLQGISITVHSAPSFVAGPTNVALPDQTRVATLQDVNNPNLDLSKVGLSSDSIAELVDGWIKGSGGNYATGTDDDQDFNTHLGVVDLSLPVGWTDGGYDAVPLAADPNGALTAIFNSEEAEIVPPLTKRAGFANANAAQIDTIKTLISMWHDSGLNFGQRQGTMISYQGFRIDQQLNGPLQRGPNCDYYLQLAVQAGSNLYAAVMVPVRQGDSTDGVSVSAGGIRKTLYGSLSDGALWGSTRSPNKSYRWAILASAAAAVLLIL